MATFTPNYNSYDKWGSSGYPVADPLGSGTPIRVDNPSTPVTYEYCDGATKETATISFWLTGTTREEPIGTYDTNFYQRVAVSASTVLTSSVTIRLKMFQRNITPYSDSGWFQSFSYDLIIPSGSSQYIDTNLMPLEFYSEDGFGSMVSDEWWSLQLDDQDYTVNCTPPPPTCTLEITGVTTVNPTFQGGSDGSITVYVSGSTGTTQYDIGGAQQTSNIFSGLAAGSYTVQATEGSCYDTSGVTLLDGEFRTGAFTVGEPSDFVAAENPIITTLNTAQNSLTPKQAISTFTFDSGLKNNYYVRFNLTSPTAYDVKFYAKDFPNRENYFTTPTLRNRNGDAVGVNTNAENAGTFAEAVQNDINLSRWYFIDVVDEVVTLTSKEYHSSLTLSSGNIEIVNDSGNTATTGITLAVVQSGEDAWQGSLVDKYSLFTDIYVENGTLQYGEDLSGGTYNNYTSLELPFSQDNQHQFDSSQVLKSFVSTPAINFNSTGATYIAEMTRAFYVRYGEAYPLVANENTKKKREKGETGYKWVINSALQWEDDNDMSAYFTGGTFLTNAPNPLDIQRNQSNYLYLVLPKDVGVTLDVRGDIDYYDGTSQTGVTFFTITTGSTNAGGVFALDISYDSLGLESYESSGNTKVKRCTFGVYSGGTLFTEERTFRFEIDEQPRKFGVAFENKLGGYDTFDWIGIVENSVARERKNFTVPREIRGTGASPQQFKVNATYDTKVTKTIVVNSGWIDEDHFDWLIELLSSNNIYSYSEENQNYLNVTGVKYTKSSLDDLFEVEVQLRHTIYENNITV